MSDPEEDGVSHHQIATKEVQQESNLGAYFSRYYILRIKFHVTQPRLKRRGFLEQPPHPRRCPLCRRCLFRRVVGPAARRERQAAALDGVPQR